MTTVTLSTVTRGGGPQGPQGPQGNQISFVRQNTNEENTNYENKEIPLFPSHKQISITVSPIIHYLAHFGKNSDIYLLFYELPLYI